jgi:hypothetical protein
LRPHECPPALRPLRSSRGQKTRRLPQERSPRSHLGHIHFRVLRAPRCAAPRANPRFVRGLGLTRRGRSFCAGHSRSTSLPARSAAGGCACSRPSRIRRWLGRFYLTWGSRLSAQSLHPRGRPRRRRDRSISPAIEVRPSGMEFEQRGGAVPGPGSWAGVRARGAAAESS